MINEVIVLRLWFEDSDSTTFEPRSFLNKPPKSSLFPNQPKSTLANVFFFLKNTHRKTSLFLSKKLNGPIVQKKYPTRPHIL